MDEKQQDLLRRIRGGFPDQSDAEIILELWARIGYLKDKLSRARYPDTTGGQSNG